jgi:hypothetical protein
MFSPKRQQKGHHKKSGSSSFIMLGRVNRSLFGSTARLLKPTGPGRYPVPVPAALARAFASDANDIQRLRNIGISGD